MMTRRAAVLLAMALMAGSGVCANTKAEAPIEAGKQAFEAGDYQTAVRVLQAEAAKQPATRKFSTG